MKYTIDYGCGRATLYTPYDCPEQRFYTLANTCFGIRKSIMGCNILTVEEEQCEDFERLEFNGDIYVWNEDGARKMIEPFVDEKFDTYYCDECKYNPVETKESDVKFCGNADMAIDILDFIKRGYEKKYQDAGVQKYIEALQMGIDALEKQKGR